MSPVFDLWDDLPTWAQVTIGITTIALLAAATIATGGLALKKAMALQGVAFASASAGTKATAGAKLLGAGFVGSKQIKGLTVAGAAGFHATPLALTGKSAIAFKISGSAFSGSVISGGTGFIYGGITGGISGGAMGILEGAASGFGMGALTGAALGAGSKGFNLMKGTAKVMTLKAFREKIIRSFITKGAFDFLGGFF